MKLTLFVLVLVFHAYAANVIFNSVPAQADTSASDPSMCYADPGCQGAIVGSKVPADLCASLGARSVYSLVKHTCENL